MIYRSPATAQTIDTSPLRRLGFHPLTTRWLPGQCQVSYALPGEINIRFRSSVHLLSTHGLDSERHPRLALIDRVAKIVASRRDRLQVQSRVTIWAVQPFQLRQSDGTPARTLTFSRTFHHTIRHATVGMRHFGIGFIT